MQVKNLKMNRKTQAQHSFMEVVMLVLVLIMFIIGSTVIFAILKGLTKSADRNAIAFYNKVIRIIESINTDLDLSIYAVESKEKHYQGADYYILLIRKNWKPLQTNQFYDVNESKYKSISTSSSFYCEKNKICICLVEATNNNVQHVYECKSIGTKYELYTNYMLVIPNDNAINKVDFIIYKFKLKDKKLKIMKG